MTTDWDAHWWLAEVANDPTYEEEVLPLLIDLLEPRPEHRYLDIGCGEGQGMRAVGESGATVFGCDLDAVLLGHATGPVARARLPELAWLIDGAFDGAYLVLVLEHLSNHRRLFAEAHRVVRPGGVLVLVANHPAFTAPGAGPLIDPGDGEVSWRWGRYLEPGTSVEPAGSFNLTMHHRPLGELLVAAATEGWALADLVERGPGPAARHRDPLLAAQANIPRLLGVRFHKAP
ncbi:MAG: class I SAM-dependent methyltransferase [Acidimicrobiia bacterium]|nr:class I SAM-dependent methyltransferase [Acidimicrobiia bacterium]MBT8217961.1 class I SAM-dependent methyltransferase [Acidimicrobiia bacterium]NNL69976.1 class I SAM-dependent methyltransferase [Acidimicrobiia bacterium]